MKNVDLEMDGNFKSKTHFEMVILILFAEQAAFRWKYGINVLIRPKKYISEKYQEGYQKNAEFLRWWKCWQMFTTKKF